MLHSKPAVAASQYFVTAGFRSEMNKVLVLFDASPFWVGTPHIWDGRGVSAKGFSTLLFRF